LLLWNLLLRHFVNRRLGLETLALVSSRHTV